MILAIAGIFLAIFLICLTMGMLITSKRRDEAYEKVKEEMAENGIESWGKKEEETMEEEGYQGRQERVLKVGRPINMAGIFRMAIIGAVILCVIIYLWTPSQVREYRVQMEKGVYQVRGIVQNGFDFTAYQSVDGKEAIGICNQMNDELAKDRGGVLRTGKVAWRR